MEAQQLNRTAGVEDVALGSYLTDLLFGDVDQNDQGVSREVALRELATQQEKFPNLAPLLWWSHGTTMVLVQEIVRIYPELKGQAALAGTWRRAYYSVVLLRKLAMHQETRLQFHQMGIPLLLFPLLNTTRQDRPSVLLRSCALSMMTALLKDSDDNLIQSLLETEILPLCLRVMDYDSDNQADRIGATFILQKVLVRECGLSYVCFTAERFYAVATALAKMIQVQAEAPSFDLLRNAVLCYKRLSDDPLAKEVLKQCIPEALQMEHLDHLPQSLRRSVDLRPEKRQEFRNLLRELNEKLNMPFFLRPDLTIFEEI